MNIRPPAVAGLFYPAAANELETYVETLLQHTATAAQPKPQAIVAPHAGLIYSGAVAASAYAQVAAYASQLERVVVMGPSHYVHFEGVASCTAEAYSSPLGHLKIDQNSQRRLETELDFVRPNDEAHRQEHSLELQMPFIQATLPNSKILPLVVGSISHQRLVELFDLLHSEEETLWVVSSDLSHFLSYEQALVKDAKTSTAIERLDLEHLQPDDACGYFPLRGLLAYGRKQGWSCQLCQRKNSGDTHGPKDRVVGYGSYRFEHVDQVNA
jgi:MEMO1 family protein